MKVSKPFCCTELKNKTVMDSSGKTIGHIGELTFTFDNELKISHFIMTGQVWDRFLERIHLKHDVKRVFDSSIIEKVDKHIHLCIPAEQLANTQYKDSIPDDEIRFSDLKRLDIIDTNQMKVGKAIDIAIEVDGSVSIIAGGGFIEEKLEAVGLKEDIDIIVPSNVINSITPSIRITVTKDELGRTLDGLPKEKMIKIKDARKEASRRYREQRDRVYPFFPVTTR